MMIYCVRHRGPIAVEDNDPVPVTSRYWANSLEDLNRAKGGLIREGGTILGVVGYDVLLTPEGIIRFITQFECDLDNFGDRR